jgi:hypothetical protein
MQVFVTRATNNQLRWFERSRSGKTIRTRPPRNVPEPQLKIGQTAWYAWVNGGLTRIPAPTSKRKPKPKMKTQISEKTQEQNQREWDLAITICPERFFVPQGTIFYKGIGGRQGVEGRPSLQPPAGFYTIDVPLAISELSGYRKAAMFGTVHYFASLQDMHLLRVTDDCWTDLRLAYDDCYKEDFALKFFPAYMCGQEIGWAGEDLGPFGGFEIYLCKPADFIRSITNEQAAEILRQQKVRRQEARQARHRSEELGLEEEEE